MENPKNDEMYEEVLETKEFEDIKEERRPESKDIHNLSLSPYVLLAVLRIVLTLVPQPGYIQPDEYFQSIEIVNEDIFDVQATRPWEFNVSKPIRSVTLPYIYAGLPTFLLKYTAPFCKQWFDYDILKPYFILVIPRLSCCAISFINDWSLYKICKMYKLNYRSRLLTLASSYVLLVYGTHTFSNAIEMSLLSLLIFVVVDCMYKSNQVIAQDEHLEENYLKADTIKERVILFNLRKSLPSHSLRSCVIVASITVLGVFNRPTFLAFAFTPVFFWLHRGLGSKHIGLPEFHLRIILLGVTALPMTAFLILVDSFYFGYLTWKEIKTFKITLEDNFVVTPYNFIEYNAYTSNLANHGLHPRVTHLFFNVPLLYNVLGISAIIFIFNLLYRVVKQQWSILPRIQSIDGLMIFAYIVPIVLLSIFPHQEPRFLIPVTLPLVFLFSQEIQDINDEKCVCEKEEKRRLKEHKVLNTNYPRKFKNNMLTTWYLVNMILVVLYGFVHQAGVYPLMAYFSHVMKEKPGPMAIHLVTSFIYPLPLSLLQIQEPSVGPNSTSYKYNLSEEFLAYEMGLSDTVENAIIKAKDALELSGKIWEQKQLNYKVYLALPTTKFSHFKAIAKEMNITHSVEHVFYPHLSTEAMPDFNVPDFQNCLTNLPKHFSSVIFQFGLSLIRITK